MKRLKERLEVAWNVLFAKNFAYFQYDKAEYCEPSNTTILKNYFHVICPNEEDDINKYFGKVIAYKIHKYLNEDSSDRN